MIGNTLNLQELLKYGANPNSSDYDNRSPLHIACSEGIPPLPLLSSSSSPSSLHFSSSFLLLPPPSLPSSPLPFVGHIDVCKILLESGADVNACDRWGKTPLDSALTGSKHRFDTRLLDLIKVGSVFSSLLFRFLVSASVLFTPLPWTSLRTHYEKYIMIMWIF